MNEVGIENKNCLEILAATERIEIPFDNSAWKCAVLFLQLAIGDNGLQ